MHMDSSTTWQACNNLLKTLHGQGSEIFILGSAGMIFCHVIFITGYEMKRVTVQLETDEGENKGGGEGEGGIG